MSEYQLVRFRAVDRPLTEEQLDFMDRQSSRAEYSKWEFEVEYHYSSFRGNINEMLRKGYDIFLAHSGYKGREIRMRLPQGLPFAKPIWQQYACIEGLTWTPDKAGKAGILTLAPFIEEPDYPNEDSDDYLDAVSRLRELLIAGDLRALYVLWLCCLVDTDEGIDEMMEPPVPHGLSDFPAPAKDVLSFMMLDPLLVDAAAIGTPDFNFQSTQLDLAKAWFDSISRARQLEIFARFVSEDPVEVNRELRIEIGLPNAAFRWPVTPPRRHVQQLFEACDLLREKEEQKQKRQLANQAKREAKKAEKLRQARMIEIQSAPQVWLKKASTLAEARGKGNYQAAAEILADLRDAIGGAEGNKIARKHAAHLVQAHPTLHALKASLRKCKLLE